MKNLMIKLDDNDNHREVVEALSYGTAALCPWETMELRSNYPHHYPFAEAVKTLLWGQLVPGGMAASIYA